jgi:short-subunit dehydrogenase
MEDSRLVAGRRLSDAASVARAGYKAMMQGKTLLVPGLGNNIVPLMARLAPRRLLPAVVKRSQERREH